MHNFLHRTYYDLMKAQMQYVHVGSVMYGVSIFFIKWSILLQYLQIFVPIKKRTSVYLACHGLIWANLIYYSLGTFIEIFSCSPISKAWDPFVTEGRCINILALNVAASTINSVSDLAILALSQMSIWRLHLSVRRKIQLSGVFLVGVLYVYIAIPSTVADRVLVPALLP